MFPQTENFAAQLPRRRRRPPRSCVECRRRKVKCDRKDPCDHCNASKRTCVYSVEVLPVTGPSSATSQQALEVSPLEEFEVVPDRNSQVSAGSESAPSSAPVGQSGVDAVDRTPFSTRSSNSALDKERVFYELNHRLESLEKLLSGHVASQAVGKGGGSRLFGGGSQNKDSSQPLSLTQLSLNKSRLFGRSHWTSTAHEVRYTNVNRCL